MCLAIPGKIIAINNDVATIDYGEIKTIARVLNKKYKVGDFVLVKNKLVVELVPPKQVEAFLKNLK